MTLGSKKWLAMYHPKTSVRSWSIQKQRTIALVLYRRFTAMVSSISSHVFSMDPHRPFNLKQPTSCRECLPQVLPPSINTTRYFLLRYTERTHTHHLYKPSQKQIRKKKKKKKKIVGEIWVRSHLLPSQYAAYSRHVSPVGAARQMIIILMTKVLEHILVMETVDVGLLSLVLTAWPQSSLTNSMQLVSPTLTAPPLPLDSSNISPALSFQPGHSSQLIYIYMSFNFSIIFSCNLFKVCT
jgi:hypothetical protein